MSAADHTFGGRLTTSPTPKWRPDVQGLRAIAVLSVIAFHAGLPLPGGFTGVDVFFVISGYVITEMLIREWHTTGRIRLGQFYLRRFKRLIPALALMVSVTVLLSIVLLPPLSDENRVLYTAIGAMAFAANIVIAVLTGDYFAVNAKSNPLLHTWTLSVEEQFYFAFPLLLLLGIVLVGKKMGQRRGALTVIGLITAVSFVAAVAGTRLDLPAGEAVFGFYSPLTRAWEFAAGALIALAAPLFASFSDKGARLSLWGGLALLATSFVLITEQTPFPGVWTLLPVVGTVLVLISGTRQTALREARWLQSRPMVLVGDWSYSLYLWHWPLIVFASLIWPQNIAMTVLAALVSVIPALLSYYLVEQPIRKRPTPDIAQVSKLVVATLAAPVLVLGGTWWGSTQFLTPFLTQQVGNPLEVSPSVDEQCLDDSGFDDEWAASCVWNAEATGPPIYLIGDSNAAHFDVSVIGAGEELDRPVTIIASDSCHPVDDFHVLATDGKDLHYWCPDYARFTFDFLSRADPGTVVVSFNDLDSYYDDRPYVWKGSEPASTVGDKAGLLEQALIYSVSQLRDAGHEVVLVQSVPTFRLSGGFAPQECSLFELIDNTCATPVPREAIESVQAPNRVAIANTAASTGSTVLDFQDEYCDETTCSPGRDGELLYFDDIHISTKAARELIPAFVEAING